MSVFTKPANDVFAPYASDGTARSPVPQEAQVWGTELERLYSALVMSTNAAVIKGTLAELNAVVGSFANGDIGLVITDPVEANRGIHKKVSGEWVKQGELPQDLAEQAQEAAEAARDASAAAQDAAEEARDIAAGYASDAVSQGNVPIYGTVSGLSGLTIPVGINAIRLNGFSAAGDGGGWPLAVEVANSGALWPWQRQSNGSARRWQLAVPADLFDPRMLGGGDDGVKDNTDALDAFVALYGRTGSRLRLPLVSDGVYLFDPADAVDFTGILIDADPSVVIHGQVYTGGDIETTRPVTIDYDNGTDRYPIIITPRAGYTASEKTDWISPGDLDTTKSFEINVASGYFCKVDAAGSDTIDADNSFATDFNSALINLGADAKYHLGLFPMLGGQEINTWYATAGDYVRVVFFKFSSGYIAVEVYNDGHAIIKTKPRCLVPAFDGAD